MPCRYSCRENRLKNVSNRPDKRFHQTIKKVKVKTVINSVSNFSEMKQGTYLITISALSRALDKIPNERKNIDQEATIGFPSHLGKSGNEDVLT